MAGRAAVLISVFSALGAFLFGLDIGYISSILECAAFKRDVAHLPNWSDPNSQISGLVTGMIVGTFSIGCICASFPPCSAYFLDHWGRKASICIGSVIFLVGAASQTAAVSVNQMLVGRLIAGFSIGLLSTVVALYQSELAPASMRGGLTSVYNLMITFGIFCATLLDWLLVHRENGWRLAIGFQIIPAGLLLLGMTCLPRSPRWLVQKGLVEEARKVLQGLRDSEDEAAEELEEIVSSVEASKLLGEPLWSELFQGRVAKYAALGIAMNAIQQLCGMNAFMYFGPRIFAAANYNPILFQAINGGVNFLATFPAIFLADSCGRRSLLVCGAIGMSFVCLTLGTVGRLCLMRSVENPDDWISKSAIGSKLIMSCVFLFVVSFAASWGPMSWVYCAEIFPLKYRSRLMAMSVTSNWIGNWMIAQFTPMLLDAIGFSTFHVFSIFCLAGWYLAWWIPETKGVLLERIDDLFDEKFGADLSKPNVGASSTSLMARKKLSPYGSVGPEA